MKIIFLAEFQNSMGGMMQSLTTLLDGLSQNDAFQITLIAPKGSEISKYPYKGQVRVMTTVASSWEISKTALFSTIKTANEIYHLVKRDIRDALFVANNIGSSILLSFMPCKRIREVFVCRGGNFHSSGLGGFFMRNKLRLGRFEHVVATASHLAKLMTSYSYPESKISIIYNGLIIPEKEYPCHQLRGNNIQISTIGYISDNKNQCVGVDLIAMLRMKGYDAHLNIYGEARGPSDKVYLKKLQKHIDEQSMRPFVHFKGFVSGEELFAETDIMISFSKSEGFGRTLVEFMLRKIPIIAYRGAGGPIDITDDGKFGLLVDENHASAYLKAVESISSSPCLNQYIQDSYSHAMENFTEIKMVKKYEALFEQLSKTKI